MSVVLSRNEDKSVTSCMKLKDYSYSLLCLSDHILIIRCVILLGLFCLRWLWHLCFTNVVLVWVNYDIFCFRRVVLSIRIMILCVTSVACFVSLVLLCVDCEIFVSLVLFCLSGLWHLSFVRRIMTLWLVLFVLFHWCCVWIKTFLSH